MPSRVTAKTDIEDPLDVPPSLAGGTVMEAGGRSVGLGLYITRHEEGARQLAEDIERRGVELVKLHIDRAYVNSPVVGDVLQAGGQVFSKP